MTEMLEFPLITALGYVRPKGATTPTDAAIASWSVTGPLQGPWL